MSMNLIKLILFLVAARTIPKFWDCLFVCVLCGGCNIWHEHPKYIEH